ncbi:RnaseH-domain-containing protein [Didymella exigua CBS 183.55]|uniref:ribonuclease H n=1 Tax=Didymella exigua CBS 183.55 TaxID=1150837 RepID=A0A6A5RJN1_9PLEO|nr:RnaseH-domain-containing protein [Didymella exigua CBS 183.55]KAF1926626.1 RnaseH-domain-containing protein [Didymella exigua CBS 183.55]
MRLLVRLFVCQRSASLLRTSSLQSRLRDTSLITIVPQSTKTSKILYRRHCRLYSTHEECIFEVSFAEPQNEDDELHEELDDMEGAKSATSSTSSGKRKRSAGPVFYAVRVGRTPGVYYSWPDCEAQIKGMKAEYKRCDSLTEAEAFVKSTHKSTPKPGKNKYYGVAIGHFPGVYIDWPSTQAQIKGCSGGLQQSFTTHEEARAFVDEHRRDHSVPISLRGDLSEASSAAGQGCKVSDTVSKKQKKSSGLAAAVATNGDIQYEPGMGPLPEGAEDGFDRTLKMDLESGAIRHKTKAELGATKMQPTGDFTGQIVVYTDGSSLGNGQSGAVAGVGVYFGANDKRNVSEPLRGSKQTNQRAELTAVARALDHVPIDRDVLIVTDSYYAIRCITEWSPKWLKNGWKNSVGKDVENRDLVEPIVSRVCEREACKAKTKFQWIKGHANDPGNVAADELAVQGSRSSTPQLRGEIEFSTTLTSPIKTKEEWDQIKKQEREEKEADDIFDNVSAEQFMNQTSSYFTAVNTPAHISTEANSAPSRPNGIPAGSSETASNGTL